MHGTDHFDRLIGGHPDEITELRKAQIAAAEAKANVKLGHPVDASRRRELGEVVIELLGEQHRVRVSHDPVAGFLHLHGTPVPTADIDADLMRSFEATAATFIALQGRAGQATQARMLSTTLQRILLRHKWAADALVQQLKAERFTSV